MTLGQFFQTEVRSQDLLLALAETLDVAPSKYEEAIGHYSAVGDWLNRPESSLSLYNPIVYPQGSFALGTAVRPLGEDEYDVDAVCLLETTPEQHSQQSLKKLVGDRLRENATYRDMLDEPDGRRCWTLNYSKGSRFHLDILPAISDPDWHCFVDQLIPCDWAEHAIRITDKETWGYDTEWPKSNPKGYLKWFKQRMEVAFKRQRVLLADKVRAEVQDVPEYQVRTPLQRLVQLLKRHRDVVFEGDECKPISVIITTLAALAYNNEDDILTAFQNVVPRMRDFIEIREDGYWVPNPVNPKENFADRWQAEPQKAEAFFQWLDDVSRLASEISSLRTFDEARTYLKPYFGKRDVSQAVTMLSERSTARTIVTSQSTSSLFKSLQDGVLTVARNLLHGNVPWKKAPAWPTVSSRDITIKATYKKSNKGPIPFSSDSAPLPKDCSLKFTVHTDVKGPYSVYWQVVNTGDDAFRAGGLRGEIFEGENIRYERTGYRGSHSIECFIVKDGDCIAQSGPFIVNVGQF